MNTDVVFLLKPPFRVNPCFSVACIVWSVFSVARVLQKHASVDHPGVPGTNIRPVIACRVG